MLDTVRDADTAKSLPYLVPALIELLQAGEPVSQKETMEYQFRRVLFEILNRLPVNEAVRVHFDSVFACMLHVLRHDNEENGSTACKTLVDLIRNYRSLKKEGLSEFVVIFQEVFGNMRGLVDQYLSEDSALLDANSAFPAMRSFKVLGEMGMVMVIMSQLNRALVQTSIQDTTASAFDMLALESPAQQKARVEYEAMGGIWAGMTPSIKNASTYSDLIHAQIKA